MCCMQMEISLLAQKEPKKPTMYGELHSCSTFSSRMIWFLTAGLMSSMIIWAGERTVAVVWLSGPFPRARGACPDSQGGARGCQGVGEEDYVVAQWTM